jgi:hypothetical protein
MKRNFYFLISIIAFSAIFSSCEPEDISFDDAMLVGKWRSGTLFYKYAATGTGTTWDTSDDVTEEEAQRFTWSLANSELRHIYILEIGGTVPKVYTVTKLTLTTLEYHDSFGSSFSFSKVMN